MVGRKINARDDRFEDLQGYGRLIGIGIEFASKVGANPPPTMPEPSITMKNTVQTLCTIFRRSVALPLCVAVMLMVFVLPATVHAAGEQARFEQQLEDQFPGSYKLYSSLGNDAKLKVYKTYAKTDEEAGIARFSTVIAKILDLAVAEDQDTRRKN
jgi:hypothetical protein